eukprot:6463024-Amphidinium_carterae.1
MEQVELDMGSRSFLLESVEAEKKLDAQISRTYIVVDAYEFEKKFGNKPRARDPRCPQAQLSDETGNVTTFYVFLDPYQPHRKLTLTSSVAELASLESLSKHDHLHKSQAGHAMKARSKARLETSGASTLLDHRLLHKRLSPHCQTTRPHCFV